MSASASGPTKPVPSLATVSTCSKVYITTTLCTTSMSNTINLMGHRRVRVWYCMAATLSLSCPCIFFYILTPQIHFSNLSYIPVTDQTCDKNTNCLFSKRMAIGPSLDMCKIVFKILQADVSKRIDFTNSYYGADNPHGTRIVFVNGEHSYFHFQIYLIISCTLH